MVRKQLSATGNSDGLGFAAVVLAGACFGSSGILAKVTMSHGLSPLSAASYRFAIASFALLPAVLALGPRRFSVRPVDALMLGAHGSVGVSVGILLYFQAINSISASLAILLLYLHPVFTLVAAKLVLGERVTAAKSLSAAAVLAGCLLSVNGLGAEAWPSASGLASGVGAGLAYSFYTVFGKLLMERRGIGAQTVTVYSIFYAAASLAAIQGALYGFQPIGGAEAWLSLAGLAAVPTLLAFGLYSFGLKRVDAGKAGITGTVEMVSALALAFAFLGERLGFAQWIGASMVLCGVSIMHADARVKLKAGIRWRRQRDFSRSGTDSLPQSFEKVRD
ncbi:MAG: EamA family transporter [Candidatus Brockarchaeota archaeon]|nr:EamA family transporter [Candidatus Brockarchaeota archaeon]